MDGMERGRRGEEEGRKKEEGRRKRGEERGTRRDDLQEGILKMDMFRMRGTQEGDTEERKVVGLLSTGHLPKIGTFWINRTF